MVDFNLFAFEKGLGHKSYWIYRNYDDFYLSFDAFKFVNKLKDVMNIFEMKWLFNDIRNRGGTLN